MRGIIFCAHLSGVGHLMRMATLAKALVQDGELLFVQAGREEGPTFSHPRLRHIALPFSEAFRNHYLQPTRESLAAVVREFALRRKILFKNVPFDKPYDYMITEQIPFTKQIFWNEAKALYLAAKSVNPKIALIASQKGGTPLDPLPGGRWSLEDKQKIERWTLSHLLDYYDKILLHCDPSISRLEEMFPYVDQVEEMVEYTGYISPPLPENREIARKKGTILVTTGGGEKGRVVIDKITALLTRLQKYQFTIVKGPLMDAAARNHLDELERRHQNLDVVDFIDELSKKLQEVSLAITLAGSTLINLYATKTPALVYPDPTDRGQKLLAEKFSRCGAIRLLAEEELELEIFSKRIVEMVEAPPQYSREIAIDGVEKSRKAIIDCVAKKR